MEQETKSKETRRVQLELPPRAYERLVRLKVETESGTYSEVMKNALRLYDFAVEQYEQGHELMLKRADGTIVPAQIFRP